MSTTIKYATYEDLEECCRVEEQSTPHLRYLREVWDYFFNHHGKIVCVMDGEQIIAIARFSLLKDNSGWLETLRVLPDYQGKGVGTLIYQEYMKLARMYGCHKVAMYTGCNNIVSKALANKFDLKYSSAFKEYTCIDFTSNFKSFPFVQATLDQTLQYIAQAKVQYYDVVSCNRTFYELNDKNIADFVERKLVYSDEISHSILICGSRFQEEKALYILMMSGDISACIEYSIQMASSKNINKIVCTLAKENKEIEEALCAYHFECLSQDLITMEKLL